MVRITREYECDVLVLGAGGAGLTAAARAAQLGRRVTVLEKRHYPGGNLRYANFTRTFGSRWQRERGLECRTPDFLRAVQDKAGWRFDPELSSRIVYATGTVFDWLTELDPAIAESLGTGKYIFPEAFEPDGPQSLREAEKNLGTMAEEALLAACETYGVTLMTECRALEAETENGRLTAVIAQNELGCFRIKCAACIVAAGGWSADAKLVSEICPSFDPRTQELTPHIDRNLSGDGLAIARSAGVELDRAGMCMHFIRMTGIKQDPVLRTLMRSPVQLTVNVNGERFCSEPISRLDRSNGGFIQMSQPYGISWCVFDSDCLQTACSVPPLEADGLESTYDSAQLPETAEELMRKLDAMRRTSPKEVVCADSIESLADRMGVDKPVFLETIHTYNGNCENGSDPVFVKQPDTMIPLKTAPFYAFRVTAELLGAVGGIKVDARMRVTDADGEPIPGLYAAGDNASGSSLRNGSREVQLLNSLAWALSGGYTAGTEAAGV